MNEITQSATITMGQRGTLVVPAEIRRELGLDCGQVFIATSDGESIRLVPVPSDPLERVRWAFRKAFEGIDPDASVAEMRAEWPE